MSKRIKNVTDQLGIYVDEVKSIIEDLVKYHDYTFEQAIKIVELGIKDMKVEVEHYKEGDLLTISEYFELKTIKDEEKY